MDQALNSGLKNLSRVISLKVKEFEITSSKFDFTRMFSKTFFEAPSILTVSLAKLFSNSLEIFFLLSILPLQIISVAMPYSFANSIIS